jgi:hypothetical protein
VTHPMVLITRASGCSDCSKSCPIRREYGRSYDCRRDLPLSVGWASRAGLACLGRRSGRDMRRALACRRQRVIGRQFWMARREVEPLYRRSPCDCCSWTQARRTRGLAKPANQVARGRSLEVQTPAARAAALDERPAEVRHAEPGSRRASDADGIRGLLGRAAWCAVRREPV